MHDGLKALLAALDAAPAPRHFFLRDDDTGWDDNGLLTLLDCTERCGVPIDLAVIPKATGESIAATLRTKASSGAGLIGIHQHGYAHRNHETTDRPCEFGGQRPIDAQREDLIAGRTLLQDLFGELLDPIFTPPWNRCSPATPALLADLGYTALSRDRGATPQTGIAELPVDVDWSKQARLATLHGELLEDRIAIELARRIEFDSPIGLMVHHEAMKPDDLAVLANLLDATRDHPRARWAPMRQLIAERCNPAS